jgi:4-amino-4-deoxy-L-arabinose transferase-like glycosyltransferase
MTTVAGVRPAAQFLAPLLTGLAVGGGAIGLLAQNRSATALGPSPDAQSYAYQALQIAAGNFFTIPAVGEVGQNPNGLGMFPSRYPPGFSLILSLAALVRPGSLNAVLLGSALISVALLVAVALVTARIFGWWAALIAALAVLATPFIWHSATIVMSDAFGGLLSVIVVWLTWEVLRKAPGSIASRWWLVALGFTLGFAVFSRLALLVLVVAAVLAIRRWRSLLVIVASAAPWALILALYQWRAYGSPLETGYGYWLPGLQEFSLFSPLGFNPPGDGPYIYPDMFNGVLFEWARSCTTPAISCTPPILTYPASLLGLYWVVIPPIFGVAGFVWTWIHRRERFAQFVAALILVNLLFFFFYFDQGVRFMAPASFPLTIVSAGGLVAGVRRLRSAYRQRRSSTSSSHTTDEVRSNSRSSRSSAS